jgi:nucleotide-binding universal stress UspA family protein
MLGTILVPLDGSFVAEQGLKSACRLAKETGATLLLVRGVLYFTLEPKSQKVDHVAVREAKEYLRTVQDNLEKAGFAVRTSVLPGDPVAAILFAADLYEADVISICTHGVSGLRHALVGSVAEAVMRRSNVPILITRATAKPAGQGTEPYRKILVPLDGTPFAEAALSYLSREHIGGQAEVILLQAVPRVMPPFASGLIGDAASQIYREADAETRQHLQGAEAYLHAKSTAAPRQGAWGIRATIGVAGQEVLASAHSEHADLIVLATHGRHGLERLLHGSVTRELLRHADVPVLILPNMEAGAA